MYVCVYQLKDFTRLVFIHSFNSHFPIIQQHPIHGVNGPVCSLMSLKVNKAIAFGSFLITNNLQRQSVYNHTKKQSFSCKTAPHVLVFKHVLLY